MTRQALVPSCKKSALLPLAEYCKNCANPKLRGKCIRILEAELLESEDALSSPMKGRGGKRKRREYEKFEPEPFPQKSLPSKPQRRGNEGLFDSKELNTDNLAEYQVKMLQEEVQKMRAEQAAAAARREKTLMKKKMKDNIKSSGKITSFFQRKQIAVVATAQPSPLFATLVTNFCFHGLEKML